MRLDPKNPYHRLYIEESEDQIASLEKDLLALEAVGFDESLVQALFRSAHSLKGASATMDFQILTAITHELETLFQLARTQSRPLTKDELNSAFELVDALKEDFNALLGLGISKKSAPSCPQGHWIKICFSEDASFLSIIAFQILEALKSVSSVLTTQPESPELLEEDEPFKGQLIIQVDTVITKDTLDEILLPISSIANAWLFDSDAFLSELSLEQDAEASKATLLAQEVDGAHDKDTKTFYKVRAEHVDQLIARTTEINLDFSAIQMMVKQVLVDQPKNVVARNISSRLEKIDDALKTVQDLVLNARMMPLSTLYRELPRSIRDLTQQLNKSVVLELSGEGITVDKEILQALYDPINHLLRNAIDHGIESSAEREALGKNPEGKLNITASQNDNSLILTLTDDGRGIDPRAIEKSALKKGLVSLEEASFYTKEDWYNLLFQSGFSTKDTVSQVSGRGVGLDVVKSNLNRIQGQMHILSDPGLGTSFVIKVPITLSLSKSLVTTVGDYRIAVPIANILEILHIKRPLLDSIYATEFSCSIIWRDASVPIYHPLKRRTPNAKELKDYGYLLITATADTLYAICIDDIIREEEILTLPLSRYNQVGGIFQAPTHITSASILNDGTICFTLDLTQVGTSQGGLNEDTHRR